MPNHGDKQAYTYFTGISAVLRVGAFSCLLPVLSSAAAVVLLGESGSATLALWAVLLAMSGLLTLLCIEYMCVMSKMTVTKFLSNYFCGSLANDVESGNDAQTMNKADNEELSILDTHH